MPSTDLVLRRALSLALRGVIVAKTLPKRREADRRCAGVEAPATKLVPRRALPLPSAGGAAGGEQVDEGLVAADLGLVEGRVAAGLAAVDVAPRASRMRTWSTGCWPAAAALIGRTPISLRLGSSIGAPASSRVVVQSGVPKKQA